MGESTSSDKSYSSLSLNLSIVASIYYEWFFKLIENFIDNNILAYNFR